MSHAVHNRHKGGFDRSQFVFRQPQKWQSFPSNPKDSLLSFCMMPCNGIFVATSSLLPSLSRDSSVRFRNLPATAGPARIPQLLAIEKYRT